MQSPKVALLTLVVCFAGVFATRTAWAQEAATAERWASTRVTDPAQYGNISRRGYAHREKADFVMQELDVRPGDAVADIGAGDGFWTEKLAMAVGAEGVVYAGEIREDLVERLKKRFSELPQVRAYLCPTDSTGLEAQSCDLVFFSQVYHHLEEKKRVDYLRHLKEVVRPTGRLCVIERYPLLGGGSHGTQLSQLFTEAEQAGWVVARCQLIPGTDVFIALFLKKELFRSGSR